jgi:phage tail-like protein
MAPPKFEATTARVDPYRNFRFKVKWDGGYVAGFTKVNGLARTTGVAKHRAGGDPAVARLNPGENDHGPITFERGVTHDVTFEQWASTVSHFQTSTGVGADISPKDLRKDITIEIYNKAGQMVAAYNVFRSWVSEFHARPELDAAGNAVVIDTLVLQNEHWERDGSIAGPAGSSTS